MLQIYMLEDTLGTFKTEKKKTAKQNATSGACDYIGRCWSPILTERTLGLVRAWLGASSSR
jgi:hypothetical protein